MSRLKLQLVEKLDYFRNRCMEKSTLSVLSDYKKINFSKEVKEQNILPSKETDAL